jgi:nucleoside-diphosphate-sugar epimerase
MHLLILGATGFIGREVALEASSKGWEVTAIVRDPKTARARELPKPTRVLQGDANDAAAWTQHMTGIDVVLDLVQPELPRRIGLAEIRQIADQRIAVTRALVQAMLQIPAQQRPLLLSVSGLDDLEPDENCRVTEISRLRTIPRGFAHIGIPVRQFIDTAGIEAAYLYLGTVYGPGKAFATTVFPRLAAGKFRIPGDGENRMPIVHVEDAARGIVHIASLNRAALSGRSFIIADGQPSTFRAFLSEAAQRMNAPAPAAAPKWLAKLATGSVLFETLTRDAIAEPATLRQTGFKFRFPTYKAGLPPTLKTLGYVTDTNTPPTRSAPARRHQRFWIFTILTLAVLIAVNTVNFPLSVPYFLHLSGGLPLLDERFHYDANDVHRLFDSLGLAGRNSYLKFYASVDLILPAWFGAFLSTAIGKTRFRRLRWIAFAAALLDYAENISVSFLLLHYPSFSSNAVRLSSTLTILKFSFYLASIVLAITGGVTAAMKRRSRFEEA